jgi:hypothetical protein
MSAPENLRIVHPDGTSTPLDVEFIGTEPREIDGDIRIISHYVVTTPTFMADGDRLDGDNLDDCSIGVKHAGVR